MKALYIAPVDKKSKIFGGVYKKVQSQVEAFKKLGIDMDYIGINGEKIDFANSEILFKSKHLRHQLFFREILKKKNLIIHKYDFVYIRFSFANPYMFKLAKVLYETGIKVFIEIPTYPYYNEIRKTCKNNIYIKIDKYLWKSKSKYINRLVVTTDCDSLFGIKCIPVFNGININDINMIEKVKSENTVNMIGVANVSRWHGYDRVIRGIAEYYRSTTQTKVNFYIVGEGTEKNNLKKLVDELKVADYVHIVGGKFGEELSEFYNIMDIGISSLALFRAGGGHDPIKSKEYVAKGMPVVIGYKDRALSEELPFVFQVPSTEEPIDINKIVSQYSQLKLKSNEIAEYARKNLTWESQIKKIVDLINQQ